MKYSPPFGNTDPNAPYINGNPETGTMGSIPPAASIEYPQREIVNMITKAGLVATDTDLYQLTKSIQNGVINYCPDFGTVNQVLVNLDPQPYAISLGFVLRVKILNTNTGPSVLSVNGFVAPITRTNGQPISAGNLYKGEIAIFIYDGVGFQKFGLGEKPGDVTLLAAGDLYVDNNSGSDNNDGLTQGTAFKTIGRAMAYIKRTDLNGFNLTVHVADGSYPGFTMERPLSGAGSGFGAISVIGNVATPQNVLIQGTGGTWWAEGAAIGSNLDVGSYILRGMKVQSEQGCGISSIGVNSVIQFGQIHFGTCGGQGRHFHAQGSVCGSLGPAGGWTDQLTITGPAYRFFSCDDMGRINSQGCPLNILNAVTFGEAFVVLTNTSRCTFGYTIVNPSNVTGKKFVLDNISSLSGSGSVPGTIAGTAINGSVAS